MTNTFDWRNGCRWFSTAAIAIGLTLFAMLVIIVSSPAAALLGAGPTQDGGRLDHTIQQFSDGTWYTGIYLYDMDYDGNPEVLIGNRNASSLEIWRYDPDLRTLVSIDTIPFSNHIHDVKAADFDKDGDIDVVVGLRFDGLYYATNTGAPGTVGRWNVREIDGVYSLQVLVDDFDKDGFLDIFHSVDYGPIKTWYGDGTGNFVAGNAIQDLASDMRFPRSFDVTDLEGDGQLDLIGTDGSFMRAFLNPGNRTGKWMSVGPSTPLGDYPCCTTNWLLADVSPSAGDLDGNGVIDQVAQLQRRPSGSVDLLVFEGTVSGGNLAWAPRILDTVDGVGWAGHAGVADLDGDGNLDVHFGGSEKFNGLRAYLGDGRGGYTAETIPLDHGLGGVNSFAVGDLNGDGGPDIVTTRYTSSKGKNSGFEVLIGSPRLLVANQITLISTDAAGNQANDDSRMPAISADGGYVAFLSDAYNLVDDGKPNETYLYIKDFRAPADEYQGDLSYLGVQRDVQYMERPVISENGRYVAFEEGTAPNYFYIKYIDRQGKGALQITRDGEYSSNPSISADGYSVAYDNRVESPSPPATYSAINVYNHLDGKTETIIQSETLLGEPEQLNANPSISGDGRYVAFKSSAQDIVEDVQRCDIVVFDRQTKEMTCASDQLNDSGYDDIYDPVISANGRFVTYVTSEVLSGSNSPLNNLFVYDLQIRDRPIRIWQDGVINSEPAISANGRYIAFSARKWVWKNAANYVLGQSFIFVYDRLFDETIRLPVGWSGEAPNGHSYSPSISADGRYIAFASEATNLVETDANKKTDIFVFDREIHQGTLGNHEGIVSAGEYHSCGLRPDGSVDCWGAELKANDHGQANDQIGPYVHVGSGAIHSCGLRPDGSVNCWGTEEWYGQGQDQSGPYIQISVGGNHNCGLKSDGSVDCWGGNWAGQAEDQIGPFVQVSAGWDHTCGLQPEGVITCWGSNIDDRTTGRVGPFAQVSAGWGHTCGLKLNGRVECWGRNENGQAEDQMGPFVQISAGGRHTCGTKRSGDVECWGFNNDGQAESQTGSFVQVSAGGTWMGGLDRWGHTCGLKTDGAIYCWGSNRDGQIDASDGLFGPYVPDIPTILDTGESYTCGLKSDGSVTCWGKDWARQTAEQVPPEEPFKEIAAGFDHACGLTADGRAICWGNNDLGQATGRDGPFIQLSAGMDYNCGLKRNGSVDCWAGDNDQGETVNQAGPFTQITSGANHNCALKPDRGIFCWGANKYGQIDPPSTAFNQINAGWEHTCGLTAAGKVNCWGRNDYGQANDQLGVYLQVSAGRNHSCALKLNGSVVCWGSNDFGQAGDNAGPFTQISAGGLHTCGWKRDGRVECWGDNQYGQATDQPGLFGIYWPPVLLPIVLRQ